MRRKVIIATDGMLQLDYAKTAHGLIRGSQRYEVLAVIDAKSAGADAGEILDGNHRKIPVLSSLNEAFEQFLSIDYLVVGVATVGGVLSDSLHTLILQAIRKGLGIVNGLHDQLGARQDIVDLANKYKVDLIDVRKPKPISELHFWTGDIYKVEAPIIALLAMDCAMGKRTTARMIVQECAVRGMLAEMIYTGQTGWMQGSKYGLIFDSTINDFVSGELEHAILSCWREEKPNLILLEGQSSLRNPSGPCGLEFLISANSKQVILSHSPNRKYFDDDPAWGIIPSVASEIEIIEKFGATVIALALNTNGLSHAEALIYKANYSEELGIPVVMPLEEGVANLIKAIKF